MIVVRGTQPGALYLLDGLLDPQSVRPQQIMTDTAGYTDLVFGLNRLHGYPFSPRLADSGGARFWRIDQHADYGKLNRIATLRRSAGRSLKSGEPPRPCICSTTAGTPPYGVRSSVNRGESRHDLSRNVFHGRKGELRQPNHQGQEELLGALGLVVNCIVLYNDLHPASARPAEGRRAHDPRGGRPAIIAACE